MKKKNKTRNVKKDLFYIRLAIWVKLSYCLVSLANQSSVGTIIENKQWTKALVKIEKGNPLGDGLVLKRNACATTNILTCKSYYF